MRRGGNPTLQEQRLFLNELPIEMLVVSKAIFKNGFAAFMCRRKFVMWSNPMINERFHYIRHFLKRRCIPIGIRKRTVVEKSIGDRQ